MCNLQQDAPDPFIVVVSSRPGSKWSIMEKRMSISTTIAASVDPPKALHSIHRVNCSQNASGHHCRPDLFRFQRAVDTPKGIDQKIGSLSASTIDAGHVEHTSTRRHRLWRETLHQFDMGIVVIRPFLPALQSPNRSGTRSGTRGGTRLAL